jgi:hypothetical protein
MQDMYKTSVYREFGASEIKEPTMNRAARQPSRVIGTKMNRLLNSYNHPKRFATL